MESRRDMFRRILRGRMILLLALLVCLFLPAMALLIAGAAEEGAGADLAWWSIPTAAVLVLYIAVAVQTVMQYGGSAGARSASACGRGRRMRAREG